MNNDNTKLRDFNQVLDFTGHFTRLLIASGRGSGTQQYRAIMLIFSFLIRTRISMHKLCVYHWTRLAFIENSRLESI